MPNLYRVSGGEERKPGQPLAFELANGESVEAVWAGSATEEKLGWWLRTPGSQLAQSEPVIAVASKADDTGELIWGEAPTAARLIFVVEPPPPGKSYRLAKMVTTRATPSQQAHYRHERASLFGTLRSDGTIARVTAPDFPPPAPPAPPAQGELF